MLRPPQPAVYIFLMDVSRQAVETGYINSFCNVLLEELDKLPGDSRTQVINRPISCRKIRVRDLPKTLFIIGLFSYCR